jgi:hypothetical protein
MGDAGMSTEMTGWRDSALRDHAAHESLATGAAPPHAPLSGSPPPVPPLAGPLSGIERAAFFAALRRKADQRIATFG